MLEDLRVLWAPGGGWRQNGRKVKTMNQGDLFGCQMVFMLERAEEPRTGVRATVVALKRGNARGAKGRRKVDPR